MKKWLLALLPIVLLAVSCSKSDPDSPKSTDKQSTACTLSSFQFSSASNPGLAGNANAVIANIQRKNMVLVTVPESADLTRLVPTFSASSNSKVRIGSTELVSGQTSVNLTDPAEITVTAEDGTHNSKYVVLVRKGDSTIDRKVYSIMVEYDIPGIGIATTKNEKLAYHAGYGFANLDANPMVPTRSDMLFRLASMSKAQTALCIMTLCEEGKLSVDDYVFAPGIGVLADMYPATEAAPHGERVDEIKIRHLLTHTSGWQYATTGGVDPVFTGDSRFYGKSLKERVAYMVKTNTSTPPGTTASYYNLGFCILGQVIEKLSGVSYEEYLRSVVAKAGVHDMWVAKNTQAERRSNECVYYPQGTSTAYGNDMAVVGACGAVIASPVELMQLLCAEDYGDVVPDILTKESLDKIYTNYTSSGKAGYGFGWRIEHNTLSNWASYHGGNISGTATIWVRGKNRVNGVLLCNSRSQKDGFDTALYLAINEIMDEVNYKY